jgi:hypothetical protein
MGEEKEKPIFAADASLFEFLGGEWKECGRGEIRLNLPEDKDRGPRLVMRSKGNLGLLLNANLFPDMSSQRWTIGESHLCVPTVQGRLWFVSPHML